MLHEEPWVRHLFLAALYLFEVVLQQHLKRACVVIFQVAEGEIVGSAHAKLRSDLPKGQKVHRIAGPIAAKAVRKTRREFLTDVKI